MSDNAFPLDFFKPTMDAALTQTHLKNKSLAHFFFSTSLPKIESASLLLFLYNVFFLLQAKKIENKTTTSTFTSPTLTQLLITASITIILLSQLSTSRNKSSLLSTVISLIYLSFSLRLLSPIIRTLTIAYSEDTVFDLTNSLLTLSFLTSTHPISSVLSRNAALAATTILTSRFSNDETSVDSGSDHNHTAFVYTLLALALVGFYADLRLLCTKNDRLKNIIIVAVIVILTGERAIRRV